MVLDILDYQRPTYPLIPKFAVTVVSRALDGERHRADNESPFDANLVHNGTAQEAN